eukprot:TRINITY_DN61082_c0_g1_i1.p1 TRINITY_DN61082_c0_g1~~TRINITY_DN61082_c0_g1_i1.p1  ORF type:complete len:242 (+),score=31.52 TRINITY_DN61082_c0_g1_i1:57-728(+)
MMNLDRNTRRRLNIAHLMKSTELDDTRGYSPLRSHTKPSFLKFGTEKKNVPYGDVHNWHSLSMALVQEKRDKACDDEGDDGFYNANECFGGGAERAICEHWCDGSCAVDEDDYTGCWTPEPTSKVDESSALLYDNLVWDFSKNHLTMRPKYKTPNCWTFEVNETFRSQPDFMHAGPRWEWTATFKWKEQTKLAFIGGKSCDRLQATIIGPATVAVKYNGIGCL